MLERERLTGAAWMLLGDDGTIAVDAAGVRRVGGAALRPDDRFQVGSIAKTVIAAGVLRLVTQKRLSLDAPVASWLPEVALDNPWVPAHPVRLRHLLDHTAGLEDASLALVLGQQDTHPSRHPVPPPAVHVGWQTGHTVFSGTNRPGHQFIARGSTTGLRDAVFSPRGRGS